MDKHINITAYDGVENLARFTDKTFIDYCDTKLKTCDKYISFLKGIFGDRKLKVLEIGSGNGKLLFRLEKEGMLEKGIGFEVSNSRILFSEKFSEYVKSQNIAFYNEDYLTAELAEGDFDLIIGIDVVINMIGAISPGHVDSLLQKSLQLLGKDGVLVFEYMTLEREISFVDASENGIYRTWKKFAESDPFKYGLDEIMWDDSGNLLWNKYFTGRDSLKEEKSSSLWKPLTQKKFLSLADKWKLQCSFFDSWDEADDTLDQEFIAVLKR